MHPNLIKHPNGACKNDIGIIWYSPIHLPLALHHRVLLALGTSKEHSKKLELPLTETRAVLVLFELSKLRARWCTLRHEFFATFVFHLPSEIILTIPICSTAMFRTETLWGKWLRQHSILYMRYGGRHTSMQMCSVMHIGCRKSLWNWRSDLPERVWNAEGGLLEREADQHLQTATMSWLVRTIHYFITSKVSGIDEQNPALWLVTRGARWRYLARWGLRAVSRKKNFPEAEAEAIYISFIDQACSAKIAGFWPRSFCVCVYSLRLHLGL